VFHSTFVVITALAFGAGAAALAFQSNQPLSSPTAGLLSEVIQIDTSNPPGNERKLDDLLTSKFKPLGFDVEIVSTPDPAKAHFIARLKGDGSKKPILLAAHADVVGVERAKWSVDPFAGIIKDGYVYGRGALDFKGGLAVFAEAAMRLARNNVRLNRDIIFLSEADEEGGQYNTSSLADSHWEKIDCEFALNEGGWIMKNPDGSVRYVSVSTADKSSITLLLTARGTSTHSSMPKPDNAIFRLSQALARLSQFDTKPHLIPSTKAFFETLAQTGQPPTSQYFSDLVHSSDPVAIERADKEISRDPLYHAMMRDTIAPVLLQAGFRYNVIPGSATATINVRTIPGTTPEDALAEVKAGLGDPEIEVTLSMTASASRNAALAARTKPSGTDTALFAALVHGAKKVWPSAPVTTYLFQAGTDAGAWRSRGVPVYGIYPYPITDDDLSRMHGNDERISVESLDEGTEMVYQTLLEVVSQ
jgi:acetylornithine deacetylase/succinyl-diaminopimelate desuccinylase-like protein